MPKQDPAKLKKVSVNLPFGIGGAEWEAQKSTTTSPKDHEKNWSLEPQMRQELLLLGKELEQYTNALAEIVGVED